MNILHLTLTDLDGGAARAAYRIHSSLSSQHINSKMLVLLKKSAENNILEAYNYQKKGIQHLINSNLEKFGKKINKKILKYELKKFPQKDTLPYFLFGASEIKESLSQINADIYHLHWINSFINFTENELKNKPLVWTLHDCNPFTGLCHYTFDCEHYKSSCKYCPMLNSSIEKDLSYTNFYKKLSRYDQLNLNVVCPSNWMADKAKESALLSKHKISVLHHGLNTTVFAPIDKNTAKQALKLDKNKKTILFGAALANVNKIKGYSYLVEALQFLKLRNMSKDIQIVVFGTTEGDIVSGIETTFLGNINDDRYLSIIYAAADVMVVPSIWEAFGQTASEALACGTPVTAFATSGLLDIIDHQKDGYLAQPYISEDLANGIMYCIENNDDGSLSKNARNKVLEKFSMEQMAENYNALYKSILFS